MFIILLYTICMLINIITPCTRPENLSAISESINIPSEHYRWIVVFDAPQIPEMQLPSNCECYAHQNEGSVFGNAQRNYAKTLINDGYVMYMDDDNILHPNFWDEVKDCTSDVVCWKQIRKDGSHCLDAGNFQIGGIDSACFMVKRSIVGDTRWYNEKYCADGCFAEDIYNKSPSMNIIEKYLAYVNYLRS